jgi:hypothetical protein
MTPQLKSRKRPSVLPLAVVAFFVVIGLTGCGYSSTSPADSITDRLPSTGSDSTAMADVKLSKCSITNDYGIAMTNATVRITNSTDRTQSYMATISVNDAGGTRIGEVNVVTNSLAAGQSVDLESPGTASSGARSGQLTCVVANVTRFPS